MEETQVEVRDERGRMIEPLPGKHTITKADASILARRRWEKYRQQAVKKIVEEAKSIDLSVSTGADAFGIVAAKQFTALMDSDKPRIADLEKLGHIMTGMDTQNSQRENAAENSKILASPEALMELVGMIEREKRQAVDQARAINGTTDTRNV
jgi:hypothetical protein